MHKEKYFDINLIGIRLLAVLLITGATVIATINYGFAKNWGAEQQQFWHTAYLVYEYFFRALTIVLGGFLTYRFARASGRNILRQQKVTLVGFSVSALIFLVLIPLVTGYWDLYYVLMPFPWSTLPFQLVTTGRFSGAVMPPWQGLDGVTIMLWAYVLYQIIVFAGTLVAGRKWQCSMLCLLNGCHAESLGIALPFLSHNKKRPFAKQIKPWLKKLMQTIRVALFIINLLLITGWTWYLVTGKSLLPPGSLIQIELVKYLSVELTLMMFLWIFAGGRGYCFYCPAGYGLGLVARLAGQQIRTGLTRCLSCQACNDACKMSIDIMARAQQKLPVRDLACVGCGLCAESCPTGNLRYQTHLLLC